MAKKDSILYIDDEKINLDSFSFIFNKEYDIYTALSTFEGYQILQENEICLVITDQKMPNETGLDFIERIKGEFPDIIYIVVTGYADADLILDAFNNKGIYRFVTKPWDSNDMKQAIANAIEKYKLSVKNKELLDALKKTNKQLSEQNKSLLLLTNSLKESELKFKNLFFKSFESICILDLAGNFVEANSTFCKTADVSKDEIIGASFYSLIEEGHKIMFDRMFADLSELGEMSFEIKLQHENDGALHLEVLCKTIVYEKEPAYLVLVRNLTERMLNQQEILKSSVIAEEAERSRIAQDLHDGIGPLLTSIKLFSETLINTEKISLKKMLEKQILESLDDAIDQVSSISNNLSPHILRNYGVEQAIKKFCLNIKNSSNVEIIHNFKIEGRIQEEIEVTLYRLIIELINNTLKHANAKTIKIDLWQKKNRLRLAYIDDGIGVVEENALYKKSGMGLFNLKNRVEALHGIFEYKSAKGEGVAFYIELPALLPSKVV